MNKDSPRILVATFVPTETTENNICRGSFLAGRQEASTRHPQRQTEEERRGAGLHTISLLALFDLENFANADGDTFVTKGEAAHLSIVFEGLDGDGLLDGDLDSAHAATLQETRPLGVGLALKNQKHGEGSSRTS